MTIGQVAKASGLSASAIRFYEKEGLLPPPVRASGQRRYDRRVLERLAVLEFAKECGFALKEVRTLLNRVHRMTRRFPRGCAASRSGRLRTGR